MTQTLNTGHSSAQQPARLNPNISPALARES